MKRFCDHLIWLAICLAVYAAIASSLWLIDLINSNLDR